MSEVWIRMCTILALYMQPIMISIFYKFLIPISHCTLLWSLQSPFQMDPLSMFYPSRYYFPLWRTEWGGGHSQPECHKHMPPAQTMGTHLLLWSCTAGLSPQSLGRQEGEWQGLSGGVHQESLGMYISTCRKHTWNINFIFKCFFFFKVTSACRLKFSPAVSPGQQCSMHW